MMFRNSFVEVLKPFYKVMLVVLIVQRENIKQNRVKSGPSKKALVVNASYL